MLQKDLLLPWRTVAENVMFGVEIQGVPPAGAQAPRAERCWKNSTSPNFPAIIRINCRAACGSAWRWRARSPSIRTCCCSTSRSRRWTRRPAWCCSAIWRRRSREAQKTALLITHDLLEAVTLSDRVLVMSRRPGTIIDEITIDMPQRDDPIARRADPKVNDYVARLMDRLDIAHASLEREPAGGAA